MQSIELISTDTKVVVYIPFVFCLFLSCIEWAQCHIHINKLIHFDHHQILLFGANSSWTIRTFIHAIHIYKGEKKLLRYVRGWCMGVCIVYKVYIYSVWVCVYGVCCINEEGISRIKIYMHSHFENGSLHHFCLSCNQFCLILSNNSLICWYFICLVWKNELNFSFVSYLDIVSSFFYFVTKFC